MTQAAKRLPKGRPQERNFSQEPGLRFWGEGSAHAWVGDGQSLELRSDRGCQRAARGRDNQPRGPCPDSFFIWARVLCLQLLTGDSYQIICISLAVSLIRLLRFLCPVFCWCMNSWKRPWSQPRYYPRHLTGWLSLDLNFQTAHFFPSVSGCYRGKYCVDLLPLNTQHILAGF